jgi:hypothetical protein
LEKNGRTHMLFPMEEKKVKEEYVENIKTTERGG